MKKFVYFLFALAIVILFSFQMQEEQKFYYAFNEKISLTNIDNKFVVRYSHDVDKENVTSDLIKAYDNSSLQWHDEKTVVLTLDSKTNAKEVVDNLKQLSHVASLQPLYKINTGLEMIITDEFVVKFKTNTKMEDIQTLSEKFGTTLVKETDTYLLLKVARGSDALSVANQYQESGLVEFSHPNFIIQVEKHQQIIPNDPYFVNQFTLHNTGQVFNDGHFGTADADIDAPEAWAMTTGVNNVLIAVLDEGISPNHPDLPNARQVRLNGSNFTDGNQNDPSPTNNMNHGNSCAGVIAATQNNNEGIAGICPNCQIMPIRIFNSNPNIGLTPAQLADAINFARNNGADIISNSWGFNSDNPNFQPVIVTAIQNATTQGRVVNGTARGCVVVFSAGNNALQNGFVHFPSNVNVSGVLTVGASDRTDLKSFYSPLGNPASSNNQVLDVTAPSHRAWPNQIAGETFEAWTIDIPGNAGYNPWPQFTTPGAPPSTVPPAIGEQLPNAGVNFQAYTGRFGGTSHSCPVVAGVAALVLSVNPNLTQQQVFNIITNNADQVGGYVYTNGRSNELGFGRVNACQSVLAAFETITSVTGPSLICSSGEIFTLNNAPTGVPISWQVVPSNLFTTSSGTGTTANLQIINPNGTGGSCVITYTIASGCGNITVQKFFDVGKPMVPTISPPGPFYKEPGQSVQVVVPDVSDQIEWGFTGNASNYTYTISQDGLQCTFTPNVPGNYQIKARATYGCEYSEYSVADVICEYNRPDLTIQNLNVSTSFNSITFNYDLVNLGNVTANSPLVNYYWSNNTTYEPGTDPLIGGSTTANIPPSGSVFVSKTFKVSSSQNYVLVYADPYDNILESNENNNLFWRPGFVPEFTDPAPETFSAYPIPFTEELTVNFVSSNNESNETEISSITQKEIYLVDYQTATVVFRKRTQNKSLTIDARKIPAGQYVLLVRGEITESMLVIKK